MPQTTVNTYLTPGFAGDLATDSPIRADPFTVNSADATNNIFGRAFSILSEGFVQAGNPLGTAIFAGFLVNLKTSPLFGTPGFPLSPDAAVPNQAIVQILNMGEIWVDLPNPANIGDLVIYSETDGSLDVIPPGNPVPVGFLYASAEIINFNVTSGLAIARVTDVPTAP